MIKLALIDNGIPYHMRNNRNQRIVHKSFLASKSDIDMYIVRKNNMYELYAEDRIGITYNIEDIYELVCQYFA